MNFTLPSSCKVVGRYFATTLAFITYLGMLLSRPGPTDTGNCRSKERQDKIDGQMFTE